MSALPPKADIRIKAQKVYREIDGSVLLMFAGLFAVVAASLTMCGLFG